MPGHYWDSNHNSLVLKLTGKYHTTNVPCTYETGGGINDNSLAVGDYCDPSCNNSALIATPN